MATPIDDKIAQKIFKAIEEQSDALKKSVAVSPSQKPIHVEIHDEDEGDDWDERDKAEYERNKQFKKLTTDTVAMKEKMEKNATSIS